MATRSSRRERRDFCQFSTALSSAFTEWLLILLLFVDTFCLYLLTKIFRSSKSPTPCLVCSRFTNLFGNEKLGFYNDSVCDVHKLEISSFAFCHAHKKLADAGEMCETCLLSFTKKISSLDSRKFLLSKLIVDLDVDDQIIRSDEMVKVPLLEKDQEVYSLQEKHCSCCSQSANIKPSAYRLFEDEPILKELALPGFDSQFLYRELKISSDSESEVPYSGDDDDDTENVKEESPAQNLKSSTCLAGALKDLSMISDSIVIEKLIHLDPDISEASSIPKSQPHEEGGSCFNSFVESIDGLGHGLEEINWINVEVKTTIIQEVAEVDVSRTISTPNVEATRSLNITDIDPKPDKVMSEPDGNLPSGGKGAQRLPASSEIALSMSRETTKIHELPASEIGRDDEWKLSDTYRGNVLQGVAKRPDADLSCSESADGSLVREVEGEGLVDCLKRRIETDRNFTSNLYKELEEERNASAIAANQAMAMINKLQEEKAAMQLEVMQYLRMMEEQSEYEQEALQKLNDQLTEREKEVKDLEAELESYRRRCWDEYFAGMIARPSFDSDESEYSTTSTPHVLKPRGRDRNHTTGIPFQEFAWSASGSIKESVLDFEDEREYISECLRRLEKNVRLFSSADASRHDEDDDDEFNEEVYAYDCKGEKHQNQCLHEDKRSINGPCSLNTIEENCPAQLFNRAEERSSSVKDPSTPVENLSPEDWEPSIKENEKDDTLNSFISKIKHPKTSKRNNIIALGDEVEHLHARLEALEADRDFLERAINSLRNGKDGIQFVQEIAAHLREIRRIGSTQREQESACNFLDSP